VTAQKNLGYDDTPVIPGSTYKVHDGTRPQPRVVAPGTASTQEAAGRAPADAVILFGGKDLAGWVARKDGAPAGWKIENGYAEVVPGTGDIVSKAEFGDCQLHLEWAAPIVVKGDSQGRGNSGVFLMGRYEIQVLDCYQNPTYPDGTTAAIYGQFPPLVNACRKPGEWQTYDIIWESPRWDESGKLLKKAYVTVLHNGVVVHHRRELYGNTPYRALGNYNKPHPPRGPIELYEHGNAVRFRNIWIRPLGEYDKP
jgi:hypothetical protein